MASDIALVPATVEHAEALAASMRAEDAAECMAYGIFESPRAAVLLSLEKSEAAWTLMLGGEVAALFGVAPAVGPDFPDDCGEAWALTGDVVARHRKAFLRASKAAIQLLLGQRSRLVSHIDASYLSAIRWAAWLGFDVGAPEPFGVSGEPFCFVSLRRM